MATPNPRPLWLPAEVGLPAPVPLDHRSEEEKKEDREGEREREREIEGGGERGREEVSVAGLCARGDDAVNPGPSAHHGWTVGGIGVGEPGGNATGGCRWVKAHLDQICKRGMP
jgi:hypothetical protein